MWIFQCRVSPIDLQIAICAARQAARGVERALLADSHFCIVNASASSGVVERDEGGNVGELSVEDQLSVFRRR